MNKEYEVTIKQEAWATFTIAADTPEAAAVKAHGLEFNKTLTVQQKDIQMIDGNRYVQPDDYAYRQAQAQLDSIREIAQWIEHIRECDADPETCELDATVLKDTGLSFTEYHDRDQAEQTINDDPLEISVRSGWYNPGSGDAVDEEFRILLCTGGPAVKIRGELSDYNRPDSPRLQYQDWGTPWADFPLTSDDDDTLLTYCRQFFNY